MIIPSDVLLKENIQKNMAFYRKSGVLLLSKAAEEPFRPLRNTGHRM